MLHAQKCAATDAAEVEHCGYGDLYETVRGFGRTIALWGFNALLFRTDLDVLGSVLIAAAAVFTSQLSCQMVIRFDLPAKRV